MYWNSIIWFLTWPALIVISYQLIKLAMKKLEPVCDKEESDTAG
jgi:hypothetical protein